MKDLKTYLNVYSLILVVTICISMLEFWFLVFDTSSVYNPKTDYWKPYVPVLTSFIGAGIYVASDRKHFGTLKLLRKLAATLIVTMLIYFVSFEPFAIYNFFSIN